MTLFPTEHFHFKQIHSTNDYALELIKNSAVAEGTLITADHQSQGRGQYGRVWESTSGLNLLSTWILKPHFLDLESQFLLSAAVAIAVAKCLDSYLDASCEIKWPNDIIYQGKKLCGILIQNSIQGKRLEYAIVGIGVNVNQHQFSPEAPYASSMALEAHKNVSIPELISNLGEKLADSYTILKNSPEKILPTYKARMYGLEKEIPVIINDVETNACILEILNSGQLRVDRDGEVKTYNFGELRLKYRGLHGLL